MRISSKKFLTDHPHENGSIVWYVTTPKKVDDLEDQGTRIDAEIQFRDCNAGPVCIGFDSYKKKNDEQKLKKIDALIEELIKFREAYVQAVAEVEVFRTLRVHAGYRSDDY